MKRIPIAIIIILAATVMTNAHTKKSDLAGKWYSRSASQLRAELGAYLKDAALPEIPGTPLVFLCPHAGYPASGPVAAYTFKALKAIKPATVVIVGFTHRKSFDATAFFSGSGFETPLGTLEINGALSRRIAAKTADIVPLDEAFDEENSVEMIIPFLQLVCPESRAVMLALGNQSEKNWKSLAAALHESLKNEKDCVIIASTDLSHYLPYTQAFKTDRLTQKLLSGMDADAVFATSRDNGHALMCGVAAVCAAMEAGKKLGADSFTLLNQRNSGDTLGDKSAVVGYLSAALSKSGGTNKAQAPALDEENELLSRDEQRRLLKLARETIMSRLEEKSLPDLEDTDGVLNENLGLFVTLHKHGELRGCIGNMVGTRPLWQGVREMAVAAATGDPRFPAVTAKEMKDIDIEISVLSPLVQTGNAESIVMGKHGVLVQSGFLSGVYLPQVATETGWTREQFMNSLCGHKAGMRADAWKTGHCDICIFTASVFGEKEKD